MTCKDVVTLSPLYLSGELDAARSAEFGAHLEACGACAREMREQSELDARLRAAILDERVETDELDRGIRRRVAQASLRRIRAKWIAAIASVAAALVLAWTLYRAVPLSASLYADAAEDHRREVVDRQSRRWISEGPAIEALAQGQGVSPSAMHLLESTGYRLERARLCRLNGRVFLHLVYSDGAQEFSMFLRQGEAEPVAGPANAADRGQEHLAGFRTGALTAVVVTEQSRDAALRLARLAAREL